MRVPNSEVGRRLYPEAGRALKVDARAPRVLADVWSNEFAHEFCKFASQRDAVLRVVERPVHLFPLGLEAL